jgi:hypothetical protein
VIRIFERYGNIGEKSAPVVGLNDIFTQTLDNVLKPECLLA